MSKRPINNIQPNPDISRMEEIEKLVKMKNKEYKLRLQQTTKGIVIYLEEFYKNKLAAEISFQIIFGDEGFESIYLNFISVEKNYQGTGLSKYVLAYFLAYIIDEYSENLPIELQNATDKTYNPNKLKIKRMKTQVKALNISNELPVNSILRSGKVKLNEGYWKKLGFKNIDKSAMIYDDNLIILYNKLLDEIYKDLKLNGGGNKKIYTGKRGGKYYIKNNKKIYIK